MTSRRSKLRSTEFINKIIQDADVGESFVPLIGSGLSSPSGIIMGQEFTNYLAFTMYLVLEEPANRPRTYGEGQTNRWDLVERGWPPLPSFDEVTRARTWIRTEFKRLCDRLELDINYADKSEGEEARIKSVVPKRTAKPVHDLRSALVYPKIPTILRSSDAEQADDYSRKLIDLFAKGVATGNYEAPFAIDELVPDAARSYHNRIVEMGIRALHDWRETLVFLSMVGIDPQDTSRIIRKERDSSVIDAFNLFITRDKQPNLGHKILSHLASPLRIQTILTTNFDTLMEDAYRALHLTLRVLPVSARGRLPEARTVASEDCLVKLHGEAQDTRADLTLGEEPSAEDKATFAAYLTHGAGNLQSHGADNSSKRPIRSKRLLIVGYSGSDYRCVQMIRHWLESNRDAVLFWVCFSDWDVKTVQSLFEDPIYDGKIRITQSSRPDLLLYELYQRLVLSLPPGGLTYEFTHTVPPKRLQDFDFSEEQVKNALECGRETGKPLESARVLIDNFGGEVDSRRLARDAIAMRLLEVILKAANRQMFFYSSDGSHLPPSPHPDKFLRVGQWTPVYRSPQAASKSRKEDRELYGEMKTVPVIINVPGGVVRASALAYDKLSSSAKKVFWIDTQDYMDADGLLRDFLRGIAIRFGSFQSRHVTLHPLPKPIVVSMNALNQLAEPVASLAKQIGDFITNVLDDYRADAHSIVVMIYGRDGYGGCSGLIQANWKPSNTREKPTSAREYDSFDALHCVMEALSIAGIQVIYFPLTSKRATSKIDSINKMEIEREGQKTVFTERNAIWWKTDKEQTDSSWSQSSVEPTLFEQWQYDPNIGMEFECSEFRVPVFRSIITNVLKKHFTYKSNESATFAPRYERLEPPFDRQLHFLYAITLFRHSRHPNALCSEATFPCPFRFNHSSIDNDFVRAEESADWLAELRQARVFFDKPGGSLWMHRDIRITLQRLLEQSPLGATGDKRRRNHHYSETRSRLHFWVGDWYFKAFCSSGHLTPVVESLHHRIMAALCAPFARPKAQEGAGDSVDIRAYRVALFESAILECCKTILTAWHWLHLWQACSFEASWVTREHRQLVLDRLKTSRDSMFADLKPIGNEDTDGHQARMSEAIQLLRSLLESLANSLTGEGGGYKSTNPNMDPFTSFVLRTQYDTSNSAVVQLDHGLPMINRDEQGFHDMISSIFKDIGSPVWSDPYKELRAIAARSNKSDERDKHIAGFSKSKAMWKAASSTNLTHLRDMVWLLGESAYVLLRRAKLNFHAKGCIDFESWMLASEACNFGIDLCKHLPPSLIDFETASKVKLHSIYSVALANLGRSFEANRHMNEAQGILSKSRVQFKSQYAMINLRRAEVRLTECYWLGLAMSAKTSSTSPSFVTSRQIRKALGVDRVYIADDLGRGEWSLETLRPLKDSTPISPTHQPGVFPTMFLPPRINECCRKAFEAGKDWKKVARDLLLQAYSSAVDDATTLLDQAERQLSGSSQSNLWWSRLHTLRLRVYGLLAPLEAIAADSMCLRKYSPDIGIYFNFMNALRISQHDDFRKLRAISYFLQANHWHYRFTARDLSEKQRENPLGTLLPDSMAKAKDEFKLLWSLHCKEDVLQEKFARIESGLREKAAKEGITLPEPVPDLSQKQDHCRLERAIIRLARDYKLDEYARLRPDSIAKELIEND